MLFMDRKKVQIEGNTNTTSASSDSMDDSNVIFKSNLEQILGHLNAPLLNKENGNDTLAHCSCISSYC